MITDELLRTAAEEIGDCIPGCLPPVEAHDFSRKFQWKMKRLIFRTDHPVSHGLTACIAVFLALFTIFATLLTVSPTVRAAVIQWMKESFKGEAVYSYEGQPVPGAGQSYELGILPEGYALQNTQDLPNGRVYIYHNGSGNRLEFIHMHGSDYDHIFYDTGNYECQTVPFGHGMADMYLPKTEQDNSLIVWMDMTGNELFSISYRGSIDELIALADSVQEIK